MYLKARIINQVIECMASLTSRPEQVPQRRLAETLCWLRLGEDDL